MEWLNVRIGGAIELSEYGLTEQSATIGIRIDGTILFPTYGSAERSATLGFVYNVGEVRHTECACYANLYTVKIVFSKGSDEFTVDQPTGTQW